MGSKNWAAAEVVNAADFNAFLANQVVMVFADATARDAGFGGTGEPTLAEGMVCFLSDVNQLQIYNGSAWVTVADTDAQAFSQATVLTDTNVVIATNTDTAITFSTEEIDVGGWHSTSTNTSRVTVNDAGVYLFIANVVNIDAAVRLLLNIRKNGTTAIASTDTNNSGALPDDASCSVHDVAAAGDYYEMTVYHSSGGDRDADRITFSAQFVYAT